MERTSFLSRLGPLLVLAPLVACSADGDPEGVLSIRLSPAGEDLYTNATVRIEVEASGAPDHVRLLRGGTTWVDLGTNRAYEWDTTIDDEGTFVVVAEAARRGEEAVSESLTVHLDRTPPGIRSRSPEAGSSFRAGPHSIEVAFDEPLLRGTVDSSSVRLLRNGSAVQAIPMLATDGMLLSLPAVAGKPGEYTLELTGSITDLAGNPLDAQAWSWSSWAETESIELSVSGAGKGPVLTNQPIELLVTHSRTPDRTELLLNGALWREMDGPSFLWDLSDTWDGTYVVAARGTWGAQVVESDSIHVTIRRSGPEVESGPSSILATSSLSRLPIRFSDALAAGSVGAGAVTATSERRGEVTATTTLSPDGREIIVGVEGVGAPDRLTLRIAGVTDLAGNPLREAAEFHSLVSDWRAVGSALTTAAEPTGIYPTIASGPGGRPVVAWMDQGAIGNNVGHLRVRRWNGNGWTKMPEPTDGTAIIIFDPAIAMTHDDRPVVAWLERKLNGGDMATKLIVSRWDGSAWKRLGDEPLNVDPGCDAWDPAIALDTAGDPVVAFEEQSTCAPTSPLPERRIVVKRWTGADWERLGADDGFTGVAPTIVTSVDGEPVLAWANLGKLRVLRWSGSAWESVHEIAPPAGTLASPTLAIDPSGKLTLAWSQWTPAGGDTLHVAREMAGAWEPLGEGAVRSGPKMIQSVLAYDGSGRPLLGWSEVDLDDTTSARVARWDGTTWVQVGAAEVADLAFRERPAMAAVGDRPFVVLPQAEGLPSAGRRVMRVRSPE